VVLVCSDERKSSFPFDVQHRNIISYKTEAPRDFSELRERIKKRIEAITQKQMEIGRLSELSPVKDTEGLTQHEMVALVCIMQNSSITEGAVSAWQIREDMRKAGYTDIATSLALLALRQKSMALARTAEDLNGETYSEYLVTGQGEQWLLANQDRLVLTKPIDNSTPPF